MKTTLAFLALLGMAQATPPGITRTQILDNATVLVARLTMAPGARETVHTHPFPAVVVQIDPGEVEMRLGAVPETARRDRGHVQFVAAEMPHAAANVGTAPFDLVTIALKPDRKAAGTQAPAAAPPGITRTAVLENADARVARVTFAPGAREPVHSHPYDLVLVSLAQGRVELMVGDRTDVKDYPAGEVVFLPRDVPHAVSNAGQTPFALVSVGVR